MEPVRPEVDAYVLDLLECRTFRKVDFVETADGHCRLRAPLTDELAEPMPLWTRALALLAEHVANALGRGMAGKYVPSTPLATRRQRAQAAVKARKTAAKGAATSTTARQGPPERRQRLGGAAPTAAARWPTTGMSAATSASLRTRGRPGNCGGGVALPLRLKSGRYVSGKRRTPVWRTTWTCSAGSCCRSSARSGWPTSPGQPDAPRPTPRTFGPGGTPRTSQPGLSSLPWCGSSWARITRAQD